MVLNYCFNAFYATVTDLKCVAVKILCSWLDFGKWLSISFKKTLANASLDVLAIYVCI